jgi:hypothetical protein
MRRKTNDFESLAKEGDGKEGERERDHLRL